MDRRPMDRPVTPARVAWLLAVVLSLTLASTAGYLVQPGDTLSEIAQLVGVPMAQLQAANNLTNADHIVAGRTLRLSGGTPGAPVGGDVGHVVSAGETLLGLALRYGSSVGAISRANSLPDADLIWAGQRLTIPGGATAAPQAAVGSREQIGALLESTARRYGMSPSFVKAVAWQESGWNPQVVSSANAVGIMQVLPSTGQFVSTRLVGRDLDLTNPADNVEAGVAFLRHVYRLAGGDVDLTLAGYYQGLRSVRDNGMYADTLRYIRNVKALRDRF